MSDTITIASATGQFYFTINTPGDESLCQPNGQVILDAGNFVKTLQKRQGLQIGSPDIVAFENDWISKSELKIRSEKFSKNAYGDYLKAID